MALNITSVQMDLIDTYRVFHLKAAEYTFFSSANGTFSRIDHMLGHKARLGKFKKTEVSHKLLSDHNTMRLEVKYKGGEVSKTQIWEAKTRNQRLNLKNT